MYQTSGQDRGGFNTTPLEDLSGKLNKRTCESLLVRERISKTCGIIMAGGRATRLGLNKTLITINGCSILDRILNAFSLLSIPNAIIVVPSHNHAWDQEIRKAAARHKDIQVYFVASAETWLDSLISALELALSSGCRYALVWHGDIVPYVPMLRQALYGSASHYLMVVDSPGPYYLKVDQMGVLTECVVDCDNPRRGQEVIGWFFPVSFFKDLRDVSSLDIAVQRHLSDFRIIVGKFPFCNPNTPEDVEKLYRIFGDKQHFWGFLGDE